MSNTVKNIKERLEDTKGLIHDKFEFQNERENEVAISLES